MCTKIKPFYFMVKTSNRIFKISLRKFTTLVFIPFFFSQCTFNSDPEPEHFHFLPGNPKRPPPPPPPHPALHTLNPSLDYIYIDRKYVCQKIYFSVFEHIFFSSVFKVSGVNVGVGVVCLSTLVLIWRDISGFPIFASKSHKIHDNWSFIETEVVVNDGCGDKYLGFILYACLHRTRSYFSPLYRTITL